MYLTAEYETPKSVVNGAREVSISADSDILMVIESAYKSAKAEFWPWAEAENIARKPKLLAGAFNLRLYL